MGFFESIKKGYYEREKEIEQEEKEREEWEKAHPNEDYNRHKILTRATAPPKPQKLYEPGHKNKSGYAKKDALINLLGISDLDEVIEQCAPEFTKAMYGVRDKLFEQDDYKSKYYELKGKTESLEQAYRELQKRESALMKQQAELIELLKEKSNSNGVQR